MTVLIAGGTGVFGRHLVTALRNAGHSTLSLGRGSGNDIIADLLDRAALLRAVEGHHADVVIHAATALRKPPLRERDMAATNALRLAGTENLLAAAHIVGATKIIGESMVFRYGFGDHGNRPLAEDEPSAKGSVPEALQAKEEMISAAGGCSLRFGLFYGSGGTEEIVAMVGKRMLPVVKSGNLLPWVELSDAAAAVVAAISHGRPGEAYNIADRTPMSFGAHVEAVATAFRTPRPFKVPLWLLRPMSYLHTVLGTNLQVDISKAERELGWKPAYPSAVTAIAELASQARSR